ncbi:MAG: hypothetical protein P4L50_14215 [Anaerolineaceae bacterium]|nr:hypothetical protein [Anaerolineaceae bacterium]
MKKIPFHPFLFLLYPIIALFAHNLGEVGAEVMLRPMLFVLLGAAILFVILGLFMKDWRRAGLVAAVLAIAFISYGQLYSYLRLTPVLGLSLGKHRLLVIVYLALLALALWWVIKKLKDLSQATMFFNSLAILLIALPIFQIGYHYVHIASMPPAKTNATASSTTTASDLKYTGTTPPPDIYYIILDAHTREDMLVKNFNYDNSDFVNGLQSLGFYVAKCAMSNYAQTRISLPSSLNMEYLQDNFPTSTTEEMFEKVIINSKVRAELEGMGYQTVSTENTHFDFTNAAHYIPEPQNYFLSPYLHPFEAMLLSDSALKLPIDLNPAFMKNFLSPVSAPVLDHYQIQTWIIGELPKLASYPSPKFVFVHVEVPHPPMVFNVDGSMLTDPGFTDGGYVQPLNQDYYVRGYVDQVKFVDSRILQDMKEILANSKTPPVIIIQGDHGEPWGINFDRMTILNAYYLPGLDYSKALYPSITPVNSFRVVFDQYFHGNFPLLPDKTYFSQRATLWSFNTITEQMPDCKK